MASSPDGSMLRNISYSCTSYLVQYTVLRDSSRTFLEVFSRNAQNAEKPPRGGSRETVGIRRTRPNCTMGLRACRSEIVDGLGGPSYATAGPALRQVRPNACQSRSRSGTWQPGR